MIMEIKELRKNNVLNMDGKPCIIKGINTDDFLQAEWLENPEWVWGEPTDSFNRISLTEEWLLKFGFKFSGYNDEDKAVYKIDDEVWIVKNIVLKKYYLDDYTLEIKHVHQLQNLYFALTGTELEINNNV